MFDAISVLIEAIRDFLRIWPRMLATDFLCKLLAFALLAPLAGYAVRLFVSLSGNSVLSDQDILFFVLSPFGIVALIFAAAAAIAITGLEQGALMTIGFGAIRGAHVSARGALWAAARRAWPILILAATLVVRVLVLAAPFLAAAGAVYWLFLTEFDINHYLSNRPISFWVAAILMTGILTAMAAVLVPKLVGWAYALPLLLFEDISGFDALRVSEERARGHRGPLTAVLVGWATAAVLVSASSVAFLGGLGSYLVPRFRESIGALVFVIGSMVLVWSIVNLMVTLLQAATFALLTVRLYNRHGASALAKPLGISESADGEPLGLRLSFGKILAAFVVAAAVAGGIANHLFREATTEDDVLVIAHRGAAGRAPENTLASVDAALEDGTDLVEIDVQETRDGRVVVLHDSDLMKIAKVPTKVWDASYDEIREIDIGSWYGPDFADQRIPTLEEVLYRCKGKSRVDIELKYYGHNQRLEERVVEIVERTGMVSDVVIMSLDEDGIHKMRELRPDWTVGLLMAKAVGDPTQIDADFLAVHTGLASRRFIRRAHRAGKDVFVWTVNDPVTMSRMLSRGADGIITDEPSLLYRVLAERAGMSFLERLLLEAAVWMRVKPKDPESETDDPGANEAMSHS
ncbi:MAG TPA: glycerophosphodiester phosphodiesterase [Vicinamibacteria bacterium]|nr:glycerophosphodiester phosphodiesterase [Vicinamibacteria bacterium]